MTPPVTPEPLSAEQFDALVAHLKKGIVTLESELENHMRARRLMQPGPPRLRELRECIGQLIGHARLLEARAARTSLWQKVTRVEVIAEGGRVFTRWDCHLEHTDSMFQDDGRTLKLFVKGGTPTSPPAQGRRTPVVNELPSIEEMAGSVSDLTGGQTLEEFMRRLRDE